MSQVYPALTQSKFDYLENNVQQLDPFIKPSYTEQELENPSNFLHYVKAAAATKPFVNENGDLKQGSRYWSEVEYDEFVLPGQSMYKPYCKKWISKGCHNLKQHPNRKHYAEHSLKSCKTNSCPKCFVDWINRQANRSTKRFEKFTENKQYHFRHIVLSPPQGEETNKKIYSQLKKWLDFALKVANIKTAAVVFHPYRFRDKDKIQPYLSPHFHLIVYGKVTNTTEFHNKTQWNIFNKGDLEKQTDIFNCVRYMLSHAGVRKGSHSIRYLGDISYRKLKVEKEPVSNRCPYCELPLTIFRIIPSTKSQPPPLFTTDEKGKRVGFVGLYDPSCFEMVEVEFNRDGKPIQEIPFYEINEKTQEVQERLLYSFEENIVMAYAQDEISQRLYEISKTDRVTSLDSYNLETFC